MSLGDKVKPVPDWARLHSYAQRAGIPATSVLFDTGLSARVYL